MASGISKGQLSSELIYEVIVSPKMPTKNFKVSALPVNKLPGQKSLKLLVGILGETMTSYIHTLVGTGCSKYVEETS